MFRVPLSASARYGGPVGLPAANQVGERGYMKTGNRKNFIQRLRVFLLEF
jgi:hypothetical protein